MKRLEPGATTTLASRLVRLEEDAKEQGSSHLGKWVRGELGPKGRGFGKLSEPREDGDLLGFVFCFFSGLYPRPP